MVGTTPKKKKKKIMNGESFVFLKKCTTNEGGWICFQEKTFEPMFFFSKL